MRGILEARVTVRGALSVIVSTILTAQMYGCAGPRVIHDPFSDHIGDSVVVRTTAGQMHKGVLFDADSTQIGLIQRESGVRVVERISVDSVVRIESLSDRAPGPMAMVGVFALCAGMVGTGVLSVFIWGY